jgi:beta-1,4-N-acetylglucosaminyltransferase
LIFVTVGTTDFDPLVQAMDHLAPGLGEEVVAQIGRGKYEPRNVRFVRLVPSLDSYYREASLVISHGGMATLMEAAGLGKPLVAVSNPELYDRHQDDLLGYMEREGHLLWCRDIAELAESIRRARTMIFRPYQPPPTRVHIVIREYLEKLR